LNEKGGKSMRKKSVRKRIVRKRRLKPSKRSIPRRKR